MKIAKKVAPGLTLGVFVAISLLNVIPSHALKYLFGGVVILVAIWLWFYDQASDLKQWKLHGLFNHARTFSMGVMWFLIGIALFNVPYLHKCGVSIRRAIGVATLLGCVFSALAAVLLMITGYFQIGASYLHIGYLNVLIFAVSLLPSVYAGIWGSKLSHKFPPHIMKSIYAVLILVVGVVMLLE
jgi:uncharacterized membrane protein YfcA